MGFLEAHQEALYQSPRVQSMRERIKGQARPDWTDPAHRFQAVVTVTRSDGRKLRKDSTYKGLTQEGLDAKFSHLVGLRAGETKAKELAKVLGCLDSVSNITELMVRLELPELHIEQT